jgi:Cyclic phosphodiesterase-like protein
LKTVDASSPVAFWLVPAPPHHRTLCTIIEDLARELKAPMFEPHVTLYVGVQSADDDVEALLGHAAQSVGTPTLRIAAVRTSPELFKALYLEFEPDPATERLCGLFRAGLKAASPYVLTPHLSLLYKQLPATTGTALARRFDLAGQRITFGQITAVRPGDGGEDWLAIERWDVWLRKDLGGPAGRSRIAVRKGLAGP